MRLPIVILTAIAATKIPELWHQDQRFLIHGQGHEN